MAMVRVDNFATKLKFNKEYLLKYKHTHTLSFVVEKLTKAPCRRAHESLDETGACTGPR